MYSRPKCTETDEDLLRLQEEFNKHKSENKIKIAATVVSEKRDEQPSTSEDVCMADIQEQIANTFEAIPENKNLGKIVEKTPENQPLLTLNFNRNKGFPVAKRRDLHTDNTNQKGSIFAQQFKKIKITEKPVQTSTKVNLPAQSFVLTGQDKDSIHEENLLKMRSMTETEILQEKEHLLATTDPAILAFLKSRRSTPQLNTNRNPTIQEQNQAAADIDIEQMETTSEILQQPNSDKWLNFRTIETNKLAWMKNMDRPKIPKNKSFEARFDFDGWLLPYVEEEISEKSRILYHHGEEAGRPGYTLQELFQLSRSNVIQQKIIALNTIANILSLQSTGVYDDVIDIPLEQVFFVLRFCLDDNTPAVLNASIKAMRNLFFNKIDETCLDCLLGFGIGKIQPILAVDNEMEDDNTINDQQLAETNMVKCLARTEILVRIRYIINTVRPSIETVVYCMDILTRLARDSQFVMTKVYKCENLIQSIITNFVPTSVCPQTDPKSPYGLPLVQALKLLRILACRSETIARDFVQKYKIMDSIISYLSSEQYSANSNGLKLQTECLHLWSVFAHYDLTLDHFRNLTPVIMDFISYHFKNTDVDMSTTFVRVGHASAIIVLLTCCCKSNSLISPYVPLFQNCVLKWFKQFMALNDFACGKLQIVASLFRCLSVMQPIPEDFNRLALELLNSQSFNMITKTIKNGSMLLNNYECHKSGANLKTVEAAAWFASEHVIPLIQTNSPIPFLTALSDFVQTSDNHELKLTFLRHANITNYLDMLRKCDKYFLGSNWFTRVESHLIMNILKMAILVKADLDTGLFYEVAVKCMSTFASDQKPDVEDILANIIFSSSFYPSEVLMNNLQIEQRTDCLETSLNNLSEILEVYTQVLGLKVQVPNFTTSICLDCSLGSVIPVDWIYTPIIVLYSNQQQNKKSVDENQQVFIIRNCLRWILIYETYFPNLAAAINPTDRFCRIACVFLGSDNLFLIAEIHNLLQLCIKNVILNCEPEINFNREIQGLNNFQDFYTQLLEQYQGVSYGDVLFGNFILVPLAQRHSTKWRKILWSEYLGVVEIFNVTVEQSVCPLELFLTPEEEDLSLLKCYRRALVNNTIRKHSILYHIAKHHVERYIERRKTK